MNTLAWFCSSLADLNLFFANKVPHRSALKERRLLLHFSFVLTLHSWHRSIQHLLDQKNPQLIAFYLETKYLQTYFHWYGAGHFFWHVRTNIFPTKFCFWYSLTLNLHTPITWETSQQEPHFFCLHFSITAVKHFECSGIPLGHLRQGECFWLCGGPRMLGWTQVINYCFPACPPNTLPTFLIDTYRIEVGPS